MNIFIKEVPKSNQVKEIENAQQPALRSPQNSY